MNIRKLFIFLFASALVVHGLYSQKTTKSAGNKETFTADGVSFNMVYVPGGLTFPIWANDKKNATVKDAYWIGETEVTYELWYKVRIWAEKNKG